MKNVLLTMIVAILLMAGNVMASGYIINISSDHDCEGDYPGYYPQDSWANTEYCSLGVSTEGVDASENYPACAGYAWILYEFEWDPNDTNDPTGGYLTISQCSSHLSAGEGETFGYAYNPAGYCEKSWAETYSMVWITGLGLGCACATSLEGHVDFFANGSVTPYEIHTNGSWDDDSDDPTEDTNLYIGEKDGTHSWTPDTFTIPEYTEDFSVCFYVSIESWLKDNSDGWCTAAAECQMSYGITWEPFD